MDEYAFTELVTGMWVHTEHLVGKPTPREVMLTFAWSRRRTARLMAILWKLKAIA